MAKKAHLYLKAVALCQVDTRDVGEPGIVCPSGQIFWCKAEPEVAAVFSRPTLIVAAEVGDQYHATWRQAGGNIAEDLARLRGMVQDHVDDYAVGLQASEAFVPGVAVYELDVV